MRFSSLKPMVLLLNLVNFWLAGALPLKAAVVFSDRQDWYNGFVGYSTFANVRILTMGINVASAQSITVLENRVISTNSGPISLPNSSNDNSIFGGRYHNTVQAGNGIASNIVTWDFPTPLFAFGADFFGADPNGLVLIGDFDGTGEQNIPVNQIMGGVDGFLGVIGSVEFSYVKFGTYSSIADSFSIDDATIADTEGAPIGGELPEPSTFAISTTCSLCLLFARHALRRRPRSIGK